MRRIIKHEPIVVSSTNHEQKIHPETGAPLVLSTFLITELQKLPSEIKRANHQDNAVVPRDLTTIFYQGKKNPNDPFGSRLKRGGHPHYFLDAIVEFIELHLGEAAKNHWGASVRQLLERQEKRDQKKIDDAEKLKRRRKEAAKASSNLTVRNDNPHRDTLFRGRAWQTWTIVIGSFASVLFALMYGFSVLKEDIVDIEEKLDNEASAQPSYSGIDIDFNLHTYRGEEWIKVQALVSKLVPVGETVRLQVLEAYGDRTARKLFDREVTIQRQGGGAYIETTMVDLPRNLLLCLRYEALGEEQYGNNLKKFVYMQEINSQGVALDGYPPERTSSARIEPDRGQASCASLWEVSVTHDDSDNYNKSNALRELAEEHSYARMTGVELVRFKNDEILFRVHDYGKFSAPAEKKSKKFDLYAFEQNPKIGWVEVASFREQKLAGNPVELKAILSIPSEILICAVTPFSSGKYVVQTASVRRQGSSGDYSMSDIFDEELEITEDQDFCRTVGQIKDVSIHVPEKQLLVPSNTMVDFASVSGREISLLGVKPGDNWGQSQQVISKLMPGSFIYRTPDEYSWRFEKYGIDKLFGFLDLQNQRSAIVARRKGTNTVAAIWYRYKPKESDVTATGLKTQINKELGKENIVAGMVYSNSVELRYSDAPNRVSDKSRLCFNQIASLASDAWSSEVSSLSSRTVKKYLGGLKFTYPFPRMDHADKCGYSLWIHAVNLGRFPAIEYILTDHALLAGENNPEK